MLKPIKHMNLDLSVIRISATMISEIKKTEMVGYDELLLKLINKFGEDVREVFVPSISFLYLLGKINYNLETDSFYLK